MKMAGNQIFRRPTLIFDHTFLNVEADCSIPDEFDEYPDGFGPTHETLDHFHNTGRDYYEACD